MKKESTIHAWIRSCRLYSLPASVMPILVGIAAAWQYLQVDTIGLELKWVPAIACLLFGLFAQIACNMSNDYFDYKSGVDSKEESRKERVLLDNKIQPKSLLLVSILMLTIACLFGLITLCYAGWGVLLIGITASIAVFAYTAGPYPLAYNALGDVCVLFFYGICAVGGSFYVLTQHFTAEVLLYALAMGLVVNNIMMVNNYRDREVDKKAGKRTVANIVSEQTAGFLYLFSGILASLCCLFLAIEKQSYILLLPTLYLLPHFMLWKQLGKAKEAEKLNAVLANTGKMVVLFGLLLISSILLSS